MSRTKDNTKAVYANYRNALKASSAPRAGARKQDALTVTADRYKMPVSEVKEIVHTAEAAEGIVHSHTDNYLREVAFSELAKKAEDTLVQEQIDSAGHSFCTKCRTTEETLSIRVRPDLEILEKDRSLSFSVHCYPCYSADYQRMENTASGVPNLELAVHSKWDYPTN